MAKEAPLAHHRHSGASEEWESDGEFSRANLLTTKIEGKDGFLDSVLTGERPDRSAGGGGRGLRDLEYLKGSK